MGIKKKTLRIGFVGTGSLPSVAGLEQSNEKREPMIIGGHKGRTGKSFMDDFGTDAPIAILGAPDKASVHVAIIQALTAVGKSMDDVQIVTPAEIEESKTPDSMKERILEGSQYLIIRDIDEFEKDLPTYKIEKMDVPPLHDVAYMDTKKKKKGGNHPFGKFINKRGKTW